MSFLAPLFLAGVAAVALPLLFHLARRTPRVRLRFPSLMFLVPTTPRLTRRNRLEHWLLLALRCLALALLAFGFARPFLKETDTAAEGGGRIRRQVLLVDRSASLRREGAWTATLARVDDLVRAATPSDRMAVIAFARTPVTVLTFAEGASLPPAERAGLVRQRLEQQPPGWEGTQLGQGLIAAAEALTEEPVQVERDGAREVVLVSDLQSGARLDALQAFEWPAEVTVRLEAIEVRPAGNAGLQAMVPPADQETVDEAPVRVRVTNSADATVERFQVGWALRSGEAVPGGEVDAYVPAGQSRWVTLPRRPQAGLERITLRGDAHAFDNTTWVAATLRDRVRVLYFGSGDPTDAREPLYFLQRALPANARRQFVLTTTRGEMPDTEQLVSAAWLVASDAVAPTTANALRAEVEGGKSLLLVPKTLDAARAWVTWLGGEPGAVRQERASRYAMWGEIDFRSSVFAPFADPRFGDFTKIHVWAYRAIDPAALPGARVLARFDTGDPALLQIPLGRGTVWLLTSGWHPADSQLGVSSKFVPLLWSLLEASGAIRADAPPATVGDSLTLDPALELEQAIRPNGAIETLTPGATRFDRTHEPGLYQFVGRRGTQRVVVGLDPGETRTEVLAPDELEQRGVRLMTASTAARADSAATSPNAPALVAEGRQKLWRWFLGATLAVVLLETLVAARTRRAVSPVEGVTP